MTSTKADPFTWCKVVLCGVAEIVFQDYWLTGVLFLTGLLFASPWMALGGLLGSFIGGVTGYLLKFDEDDWKAGMDGFNPALVGIAMFFHFAPGFVMVGVLVVGCVVTTLLNWGMRKLPFPTYTTPFIVITWILFAMGSSLGLVATGVPAENPVVYNSHTFLRIVQESFAGLAEIMLSASIWTGLLFLAGISISNWRHGIVAVLGSLLGTLIGHYHRSPVYHSPTIGRNLYKLSLVVAEVEVQPSFVQSPANVDLLLGAIVDGLARECPNDTLLRFWRGNHLRFGALGQVRQPLLETL